MPQALVQVGEPPIALYSWRPVGWQYRPDSFAYWGLQQEWVPQALVQAEEPLALLYSWRPIGWQYHPGSFAY